MEFVSVDAGAEGWSDHVGGIGVVVAHLVSQVVLFILFLENRGGVRAGAFHAAVPFAGASHVVCGKSVARSMRFELPADVEPRLAGQVRLWYPFARAPLDPRVRPRFGACSLDAFHPVAHEHVGRRDLFEQGLVGGGALPAAPLPGEHLAVIAVDRRQQAPAVHVGAVGHDHVVHHAIGVDARFEVPAPCAASSEGTRVASQPPLGRGFEQPVQEGTQCGRAAP